MIIKKILNNNAIITYNKQGKEIVAMGKGIAFQKKNGDEIDDVMINKIYMLSSDKAMNDLEDLISSIPIEYANIAYDIVNLAKEKYNKKLNDSIYVSLMDHIHSAIERQKLNIRLTNPMLWDIKQFYREEFEIGIQAIDMIEKELKVEVPIDEAGFIALHIAEAQLNSSKPIINQITLLIEEICSIVRYYFKIDFDENSVYFSRFITHLKFFSQRLFLNQQLKKINKNNDLLDIVINKYKNSYGCVEKIKLFVSQKYHYSLSEEEQLYLTIHIQRVVDELRPLPKE